MKMNQTQASGGYLEIKAMFKRQTLRHMYMLIAIIILNTFLIGILLYIVFSTLVTQKALLNLVDNINGMYNLFHLKNSVFFQ